MTEFGLMPDSVVVPPEGGPRADEEAARRRLWDAIQILRREDWPVGEGRKAIDLVNERIGEFAAALRAEVAAGGQPPSDGMPSDRGKLREIADIIGDAMHGWVEMSQTDNGYEIIHVDDRVKGLEVFAALTLVWPKVLEVLRAAERGVSAVPPTEEPRMKHGRDATFWYDSYRMLADAIEEHLLAFVRDGEEAEESILVRAVESAAAALRVSPSQEAGTP